jgi:long-subunit acyl-CoA synthetase (AMP-forming)
LQNEQNASIIQLAKEIALRVLGTIFLPIASIELCASASASEALPENGAAKLAVVLYTSGATGLSKGVALSARGCIDAARDTMALSRSLSLG